MTIVEKKIAFYLEINTPFTNFFRVGKLRLEDIKGHPSHSFISIEWVFPQGASLFILGKKKRVQAVVKEIGIIER